MAIKTATILVDLGNSETRVKVMQRKKCVGEFTLDNRFASLPKGYRISKEYGKGSLVSVVFEHSGVYYANGALVEREFTGSEIRPTAMRRKCEQISTELSIKLALLKVAEFFAAEKQQSASTIGIKCQIKLLLPPTEFSVYETAGLKEELEKKLKGISTIDVIFPEKYSVGVSIEGVEVFPEGFSAFFASMYGIDSKGILVENEENADFTRGYVLVVDIGAGTTDVLLLKENELIQNSMESFDQGGNTVKAIVSNDVKRAYGFTPTDMDSLVRTCVFEDGGTTNDVTQYVDAAKLMFSKKLVSLLQTYLERMLISLREVKGLLIVGGGALETSGKSKPMSKVAVEYLQELAPNIRLLDTAGENLRTLNIKGLEIMYYGM